MPSASAAVKIARALGVSVEYLVTGEENRPNKSSLGPEIRSPLSGDTPQRPDTLFPKTPPGHLLVKSNNSLLSVFKN